MGPLKMDNDDDDDDNNNRKKGLSTEAALLKLHDEISVTLNEYLEKQKRVSKWSWFYSGLHHSSEKSLLCWVSMVVLILDGFLMILISIVENDNPRFEYLAAQGLLLFILVALNLGFVLWDSRLLNNEIPLRVKRLMAYVKGASKACRWKSENYPHLCTPYSPCITLQWTYRDGALVNLPWALLVDGDLVVIRPGQPAPGHCTPISDGSPVLQAGEVYSPVPGGGDHNIGNEPNMAARKPLCNKEYLLKETPYLRNLKLALAESLSRPITYHNRARHLLLVSCVEQLALPLVLVCILCINILRYMYVRQWVGTGVWTEVFILLPITITLPLLPMVFPTFWLLLMCYGNARVATILQTDLHLSSKKKHEEADPFDETDADKSTSVVMPFSQLKRLFLDDLLGRGRGLTRSANILHVLGSVTSLCCVDKKGILSWPNPTAEKIFFLRKKDDLLSSPSVSSVGDVPCSSDTGVECASNNEVAINAHEDRGRGENTGQMQAEVLDLTHDHSCPFRLVFDDALWDRHLNSLKPLGLAILLNTCNMATQDHYTQFCSHVTCEALYNEDLVPVTNRRCLCEVAKQIGFTDSAVEVFNLESQLSTFRHVEPESVRNDMRFAKSLPPSTKLKFPFPHMVAVVVRDLSRGSLQLFSQGTADIVLDSCTQYWDGEDLSRLSPADRRKVQDFYQRTSLSAYCTAFAYRPLFHNAAPSLSSIYMELPTDSQNLYKKYNHPDDEYGEEVELLMNEDEDENGFPQYDSNDSMFEEEDMLEEPEVHNIDGCFKLQCNQIFIGMVTMQYQAQADIVQLIEQLERACIRFVHFSKENELRSRVFSEKMGLESGWNCHISLLSERTSGQNMDPDKRADSGYHLQSDPHDDYDLLEPLLTCGTLCSSRQMSMSAPCTYKPESEIPAKQEEDGHKVGEGDATSSNHRTGGETTAVWQSLSCLTDSTEQSVPVNFDMSNRAKLPRGIDKIRPHLELVDNVPLLVSLFTDCTPTTTREMITIMQDYGEVVCVIGSSVNADNIGIFLKANASVAVEPLYPQVCQKVSVFKPTSPQQGPSPVEISKELNSISCSITISREDEVSLFHLIKEARHFMLQVWNCTQFWVCCLVSLSCTQLLATLVMLPPLLTTGQVLFYSVFFIPSLSLSLVGTPVNKEIMQRATGKNNLSNSLTTEVAIFVLWCYGTKFLPTICLVPVLYTIMLSSYCEDLTVYRDGAVVNTTETGANRNACSSIIYPSTEVENTWGGWTEHPYTILLAQHLISFLLTLHFLTISFSFVQRDYLVWRRNPFRNRLWTTVALFVLTVSALFSLFTLLFSDRSEESELTLIDHLPPVALVVGLISPLFVFFINEFVKWQEIKANVRYQKRARLEFGTKLGMNSPF